jgi:hypothetical protein
MCWPSGSNFADSTSDEWPVRRSVGASRPDVRGGASSSCARITTEPPPDDVIISPDAVFVRFTKCVPVDAPVFGSRIVSITTSLVSSPSRGRLSVVADMALAVFVRVRVCVVCAMNVRAQSPAASVWLSPPLSAGVWVIVMMMNVSAP